ncbi:rhodanese-like domain-containing protein [Aestuariibacter salexigens]|uniref:rhodanese-like domain-containing protein n=1 Tax=Aestuariibacter salexigens TaxID=226010 RepID=UPI0004017013|nr:rhodanese-like domain-containing protein [Aestuariibacter salexigens]
MDQLVEFIGNHYILSGIWMALFVMLVYSFVNATFSPVKMLSTQDATLLMNREDAVVLDTRPLADFNKGHILGARQIPAEQLNQGDFQKLEKFKSTPIIVVCAMGMNAKRTALQMLKAGFSNVSVLQGGMGAWTGAGLPVKKK